MAKRDYELEQLLYTQKMKPAKENPLKSSDEDTGKGFQIDVQKFEPQIDFQEDEDEDKGGIRDKAAAVGLFIGITCDVDGRFG